MNKSTLMQEAIEDAKLLKETAKKAAMDTLKESFEPTVNKMVMSKLIESDDEDLTEVDDMELDEVEDDEVIENDDLDENEDELEESDDAELDEIIRELEGDNVEESDDELDEIDININGDDDLDLNISPEDEEESNDDQESEEVDDDELESTLDEILAEFDLNEDDEWEDLGEDDDVSTVTENKQLRKSINSLKAQVKSLTKELNESKTIIKTQKEAINEVALLNTKLLYMTKISNKFNLTTEAKGSVLQSLDRCSTIREAKLTYATIVENFQNVNSTVNLNKPKKSASESIKVIKESKDNNGFTFINRWQQLAGIK